MTSPHRDQPVLTAGADLDRTSVAVVLLHGRGATARSILDMASAFDDRACYLAPQAAGNTWYPNSFLAPTAQNEPHLSGALDAVQAVRERATGAGVDQSQILLVGFSQGGCLASEFVARNPGRYGGLAALSGGLIGETVEPARYDGDFEGMPAFFGCSDVDPHIPAERVHESASVFESLGADVTTRLYEGMGHRVNRDEQEFVAGMITDLVE